MLPSCLRLPECWNPGSRHHIQQDVKIFNSDHLVRVSSNFLHCIKLLFFFFVIINSFIGMIYWVHECILFLIKLLWVPWDFFPDSRCPEQRTAQDTQKGCKIVYLGKAEKRYALQGRGRQWIAHNRLTVSLRVRKRGVWVLDTWPGFPLMPKKHWDGCPGNTHLAWCQI